jgi:histone H3/H4
MSSNVVTPQKQKEQQVRKKIHHLTVGASAKIVSEIVRLQSAIPAEDVDSQYDRLMIPKAAFIRLVREVSQDVCQDLGITRPVFWAGEALGMLHLIAEAHLVDGFLTADVLRAHRAQATLMPDDMKLATFITSHGTTEPPELTKEIKRLQRYVAERNARLKDKESTDTDEDTDTDTDTEVEDMPQVVYKRPFSPYVPKK